MLAVSSGKRAELAPEVPTVNESGLPGFDPVGWYAMFGPSGTEMTDKEGAPRARRP